MRQLLVLTASDLLQRIRDKSVIIFALVVPLALMSVFNLVFDNRDKPRARTGDGGDQRPRLRSACTSPDGRSP